MVYTIDFIFYHVSLLHFVSLLAFVDVLVPPEPCLRLNRLATGFVVVSFPKKRCVFSKHARFEHKPVFRGDFMDAHF